ncbi:glyoxalase superfamily protein [Shinella sp. H4-D48]|uniref:Glyoxalase superfamily protein n=1 Tax=Shinella sedimenti TaxID=2919913 RepID=A0ABT0CPD9_9HYPH|nr:MULTISPECIES: glyoxalase superfamily protein [Shinella]MCJ8150471.1 glyoxalase superfamily protein [Shinella sedimenti]UNK38700.1 glyoxalase superfamily protein [Shinella sp. H4-D48]
MRPLSTPLPSLDTLKDQAKRLRARFADEMQPVSHSRALELIAAQYGFRDWNTLHAAVGNRPPFDPWMLGSRVRGSYLGQPFDAEVIGVQALTTQPGRYRMTLHFDTPVDVVTFDSFSAFRQRVSCTVDETGRTLEKTSNGRPHLELEW